MHSNRWAPMACLLICISAAGCVKEKKEAAPIRLSDKLGTVSLNRPGAEVPVDTVLKIGDRLITGEKSMAMVLLPDSSTIRIFEKSEFTIIKMESAGDEGGADTRLAVDKGRSMFVIEKLARGGRLSVTTPTAVAAVRGTTFTVEVRDKNSVTDLKVVRGSVYIEAKDEARVNSLVKDGEMIALSCSAVVDEKKPIPEKKLKELKEEEKSFIKDSEEPEKEEKKEAADKAKSAPPVLKTEAAIKEYYHKLEEVSMDDGTILVGAVIFQNAAVAKIHTASGIIQVPTGSIKTIRMR